jgi:hypothetical protein
VGATADMLASCRRNSVDPEPWGVDLVRAIGTPLSWTVHADPVLHYRKIGDSLLVLFSACIERDGKRWIHVSCSRPSRLPSWEDLREVKDTFIGRERKALQVIPPASEHINIHPHCLHLWACLDGDGLPDFRKDGAL